MSDERIVYTFMIITKHYNLWISETDNDFAKWLLDHLMQEVESLVILGVEPDKKYQWAQLYHVVKNKRDGKEEWKAMLTDWIAERKNQ